MRVPPVDSGAALPAPGLLPGASQEALRGSWSATRWEYRDAAGTSVDLVAGVGSVVTVSLSAGAWVLTFTIPGRGLRSVGGTFADDGRLLVLRAVPEAEPVVLQYRVRGDALTWSDERSAWDFDGDGVEEPATLVAVFVRL